MKYSVMLTVSSLLSILLMSFHLTDDFLHGAMDSAGFLISVAILVLWLFGTLVLAHKPAGYIITLLGAVLGLSGPVVHMTGGGSAKSHGFFFVWTLLSMGVTSMLTLILSVQGVWSHMRTTSVRPKA